MKTFQINFGGFYNSIHDEIVEQQVSSIPASSYKDVQIDYCKGYIKLLNEELGTDFKFVALDSPKEYNFITDVIIAECSDEDIKQLDKVLHNHKLMDKVKELIRYRTTSREGYIALKSYDEVMQDKSGYHVITAKVDAFLSKYDLDIHEIFA